MSEMTTTERIAQLEQRINGWEPLKRAFTALIDFECDRADELQRKYDALTGEKFSDRVHAALRSRAEIAEARVAELLDALTKLTHEAVGFLAMADMMNHGVTNVRVLQDRIEAAHAAIAKAEGR